MVLNKPGNADISFALDTYHGVALPDQMVGLFFVFKVFHTFKIFTVLIYIYTNSTHTSFSCFRFFFIIAILIEVRVPFS